MTDLSSINDAQLNKALALAAAGLPVFPCGPEKRPLTLHGHKDATTNDTQIMHWWTQNPNALVGVPTGAVSGLFMVDVDIDRASGEAIGEASLTTVGLSVEGHPHEAKTRSGGVHLPYRWREGLPGCSAGRLPGVDIRSEGGYVIAWEPERLIAAKSDPALDAPPRALLAAVGERVETVNATKPSIPARTSGLESNRWAEAAFVNEIARVRAAPEGARNDTLNRAAFNLGQIVGGGGLERGRVEATLMSAAGGIGLGEAEARATIASGLSAGAHNPRIATGGAGAPPDPKPVAHRGLLAPSLITATPFTFVDPSTIPQRGWVYPPHLIRKFLSVKVAPPGVGKTALAVSEALAMTTGRNLLALRSRTSCAFGFGMAMTRATRFSAAFTRRRCIMASSPRMWAIGCSLSADVIRRSSLPPRPGTAHRS